MRNTAKSHTVLDGYPKVCSGGCGKPVRITVDTCWFETLLPENVPRSWHFACRRAR